MSLFFKGQRHPKVVPVERVPDWEAALTAVSDKAWPEGVASVGNITVEQAHKLRQTCHEVEAKLLRAIQDGTVKTQAEAVDFIRANTEGFFPAAKFIDVMKHNPELMTTTYTTETKTDPLTGNPVDVQVPVLNVAKWSEIVTAAKGEEV